MTNGQIAKVVAEVVYKPKKNESDPDYAVQLMIEKIIISQDITNYSKKDLEKNILWHLNMSDEVYVR